MKTMGRNNLVKTMGKAGRKGGPKAKWQKEVGPTHHDQETTEMKRKSSLTRFFLGPTPVPSGRLVTWYFY